MRERLAARWHPHRDTARCPRPALEGPHAGTPARRRPRLDLVVLAFPLYVDSLPYLAIEALERIAAHRQAQPAPVRAAFLAIANCGFPEVRHNDTALAICEQFAAVASWRWCWWAGAGRGGAINGQPLARAAAWSTTWWPRLDLSGARVLAEGEPVLAEAIAVYGVAVHPCVCGEHVDGRSSAGCGKARRNHVLTRAV